MNRQSMVFIAACAGYAFSFAQPAKVHKDSGHVMITPAQQQWQPAPAQLPPGAFVAVLDGDPTQSGSRYAIAVRMPGGYRIPPHWHPMDASVLVVKGTFVMGLGEKFDASQGHELSAGSFMRLSRGVRHFEWTKGETIVYVYGDGPLDTIYVNPSDDPRQRSKTR